MKLYINNHENKNCDIFFHKNDKFYQIIKINDTLYLYFHIFLIKRTTQIVNDQKNAILALLYLPLS